MANQQNGNPKAVEQVEQVTIRFAGDSGDGMQLTGSQFSETTAILGNDLSTLPDYPAEIRAPAGSLAGVSSFQLQFGSAQVQTPGDSPDVLVAMNPAGLKVNLADLKPNGIIIVNNANFTKRNLQLADWDVNPLEDSETLSGFRLVDINMTQMIEIALADLGLSNKVMARSTNMFALGLTYWLYDRPLESTIDFLKAKFAKRPEIVEANRRALEAGYNYGDTTELMPTRYTVTPARMTPGTYRNIMGNHAAALGLLAASQKADLQLVYASYPITPASDILHILSTYKNFGVITFQAEDEIAAITSAIGASFAGSLAITGTSGPGLALKTEAIGLAVTAELPLVIINVQRGGPSTGLPTKTEQADLLQAIYGRNGEVPVVVLAACTPADCFTLAFEACRIAVSHMVTVIMLSDNYLGNGSEPWLIPKSADLPEIENNKVTEFDGDQFLSFKIHNEERLARPWAVPGTPGLEHRIGGLEKDFEKGSVNLDPQNHARMTRRRQQKVDILADHIPLAEVYGDQAGDLLVLGWGSTYGAIRAAVDKVRANGRSVSHLHLRYLNPMQKNVGEILERFDRILVPEINAGQLSMIIRSRFLRDNICYGKIEGKPFLVSEIETRIMQLLEESVHAK